MAKVLKFYGVGGDLLVIEGLEDSPIEVDCLKTEAVVQVEGLDAPLYEERLRVVGIFSPGNDGNGMFCIGVMPVCENRPIPNWPVSFSLSADGCSACMSMTVPDTATVFIVDDPDAHDAEWPSRK